MQYSQTGKACPVEGKNAEHATDRPYADARAGDHYVTGRRS